MNKTLDLLVLDGDGIGPEITAATLSILERAIEVFDLKLNIERDVVGVQSLEKYNITIREELFEKALRADGLIMGPVGHHLYPPKSEGGINPSGLLRKRLELFANIRPAKTRPNIKIPVGIDFDILMVRENTEGFYADRTMVVGTGEFMPTSDLALSLRKVTREGSRCIAEEAFKAAMHRKKKVTSVHKVNVLTVTDGLFLEEARKVAAQYPEVEHEEQLVDSMAAMLIRAPQYYDVLLTTNMFGDILSDEASELAGGLGLAPSINAGHKNAMAQAQHGSAPDITGKGIANPSSLIGSMAMLLNWLGVKHESPDLIHAGKAVDTALDKVLLEVENRTPDLGGKQNTSGFAELVRKAIG